MFCPLRHLLLSDLLKAILISGSALIIVMGLCEFLIRRNNVLRFLFGMKPQAAKEQQAVLEGVLSHRG